MANQSIPVIAVVVFFGILPPHDTSLRADDPLTSESAPNPAEAGDTRLPMRIGGGLLHPIREKMQQTITFEGENVPLSDVVDHCAAEGRFTAILNLNSPAVEHLNRIGEISVELHDVTIETALDRVLHPYGLEWVIRRDGLFVTTPSDVVDNFLEVAVFDVRSLIAAGIDGDQIIDTIYNGTAGPWFNLDGFGGQIGEHDSLLFVRQTPRQMELTEQLLETMRSAVSGSLEHGSREVRTRTGERESVVFWKTSDASDSIASAMFTKVYDIRDLQRYGLFFEPIELQAPSLKVEIIENSWWGNAANGLGLYSPDPFLDILLNLTRGPWFDLDGKGGLVDYAGAGVLVVRQTAEAHQEVESVLADVRTAFSDREPPELLDINRIETHLYRIDPEVESAENVLEAIETFIAPESWGDDNADTGIMVVGNAIIARNTYAVYVQIQELLIEAGVWADRRQYSMGFS